MAQYVLTLQADVPPTDDRLVLRRLRWLLKRLLRDHGLRCVRLVEVQESAQSAPDRDAA